ncbi:MAG: lytic transglycosylase domain-containing protein [Rhodospirillales bacterium]|nr:lytic transglycosylase domain-containing protein [Rhodospirillales bacterium]
MARTDNMAVTEMLGRPVREDVLAGLRRASEKTGVSFDFLLAEASRESGLDPKAKARTTSAAGLFQFTNSTWLDVFREHGAKYGQAKLARKICRDEDGLPMVADPMARKAILDLRNDPEMAALMAAEYAKANEDRLNGRLGREVGATDVYLAHFLGPNGATRFLKAQETAPGKPAARLMPIAAKHNRSVFYENGKPVSVAALYAKVQDSIDGTMRRMAEARQPAPAPAPVPVPAPVVALAPTAPAALVPPASKAPTDLLQEARTVLAMAAVGETAGPRLAEAFSPPRRESEPPVGLGTPRVSMPMPPAPGGAVEPEGANLGGLLRRLKDALLG